MLKDASGAEWSIREDRVSSERITSCATEPDPDTRRSEDWTFGIRNESSKPKARSRKRRHGQTTSSLTMLRWNGKTLAAAK